MRIVGVLHFMAQLGTWRTAQYGAVRDSSHNNNIAFYRRRSQITKTSVPENSLSRRLSSPRVDREKTAITRCHNKDAAPADNTMINTRRYLESAGRARLTSCAPARPAYVLLNLCSHAKPRSMCIAVGLKMSRT